MRAALYKKIVDLDALSDEHIELLKKFFALYKANIDFWYFLNIMYSQENLEFLGGHYELGRYWVDKKLSESPIFMILDDLSDMLGMKQGMLADEFDLDFPEHEKILEEFLEHK